MADFPTEDEEFELQYGDELELIDDISDVDDCPPKNFFRRSLNFEGPEFQTKAVEKNDQPWMNESVNLDNWVDEQIDKESKKRKVGELSDGRDNARIQEESQNESNKRTKTDKDDALIDKISITRQVLKEKTKSQQPCQEVKDISEKISRRVPRWPFVPITFANGERWYLRLHSEAYMEVEMSSTTCESASSTILSSISSLWDEVNAILAKKKQKEYEVAFERRLQALEEAPDSGCEMSSEDEEQHSRMFVETYKPYNYLDLLSDETVNRQLLQWLKLWDKVVFNRERVVKIKPKEDHPKKTFKKLFKKFEPAAKLDEEMDENGCPKTKVALLCGPPGLGKTTLATVVAKHAGYNPVEMNASDDRSPEAFRLQLEAATQMRAVMGVQPRPNCLILDEIDGAPAAAIEVLLKYLSGKDITKKKAKKKEAKVTHRPIICICNDLFVSALRNLRQVAFVLQFPPTTASKLAQRLGEVACREGLKTDMTAMLALAEKTQNDVRACLSALQFFKSRCYEVRVSDVQRATLGLKDLQKGLFSVWQEVFQIQKSKRKVASSPADDGLQPMPDIEHVESVGCEISLKSRMQSVLNTVQSFGDYERVAQGVFENYLKMNLKDTRLKSVDEGLRWFSYFDLMTTKIHRTQNYTLMAQMPYCFVKWHFLFSSFAWPKITYPKTGYEVVQRQATCRTIVEALQSGMSPEARSYAGNGNALLMDTLPFLPELVTPNLRPVNAQLYSKREREDIARAVQVMLDYNLAYVQQRTLEGSYEFVLEPNIEEVTVFPEVRSQCTVPYTIKQLLAHELELERMRREEAGRKPETSKPRQPATKRNSSAPIANPNPAETSQKAVPFSDANDSSTALPNHLQKLTARPVRVDTAPRNYFSNFVVVRKKMKTEEVKREEIVKSPIWYHFKEGFSNAVRRYVRMRDLL